MQPNNKVVDFDSINPIINYNGVGKTWIGDHPRVVHNLLGYIPVDQDWIAEDQINLIGFVPPRDLQNLKIGKKLSPDLHLRLQFQLGL